MKSLTTDTREPVSDQSDAERFLNGHRPCVSPSLRNDPSSPPVNAFPALKDGVSARKEDDPEMNVETTNPALILAEMAREMFPGREVVWSEIAAAADYCEQACGSEQE